MTPIALQGRHVGPAHPCLIVGEVAQAHDGSLGTAHAYIDAIQKAGADAVKFQTHIASAESTPAETWRVPFSRQEATRFDYWRRMEFTPEQWLGLACHARESGLLFLSSPFCPQAVELLERVGVPAWKVGAGEITNLPMIDLMARTAKPVLLSTGMASWSETDAAVATVRAAGGSVAVLQCTSSYPCPPERVGLNVLAEARARYDCPVGLSDHSGAIYASLAAVTLGASIIEVHVALSRECFGPDVVASVITTELSDLVRGVRFIERALARAVDKDAMAEELLEVRKAFRKSLVAARDLAAGHAIREDDLCLKKPGTGIPGSRLASMVGRRLRRALKRDEQLTEESLAE